MDYLLGEITTDNSAKIDELSQKVMAELEKKMPELLNGMGNELYKSIYNYMTEDKVVDTGRLRGSISYSTPYNDYNSPTMANKEDDFIKDYKEKNTVVYGSNVEYASYVNSGTSKQKARKFMQFGTTRAVPQIKSVVEKILKEG